MEFRYTDTERQALAKAVPDADWLDAFGDSERLVRFAHHDEFRADKAAYIARQLEWLGRECLKEEAASRTAKDNTDEARKIARDARDMLRRLAKITPSGTTYGIAFLGRGRLIDNKGDYIPDFYRHEVFLALLGELISNEEEVVEGIAAAHANDLFDGRHHPALARFVDAAIIFWQHWTNKPAGASKEGGPAARFLCAAANPLIAFAGRHGPRLHGPRLRRAGLLTLEAAGQLIEENRRIDPQLD